MFIINPYRYAATGPQPITDFFASIHTSSLYFTLGPVGLETSFSIHTSSVDFTLGAVLGQFLFSDILKDSVELATGSNLDIFSFSDTLKNSVELKIT